MRLVFAGTPEFAREALTALHAAGQSIWLDYIDRTLVRSGELARRIQGDALTGMTSNPTIFEKALAQGTAYDEQLRALAGGRTPWAIFEAVETDDVRDACDVFRATYDATKGGDGYVSIEVSPGSAHDAAATVEEMFCAPRLVEVAANALFERMVSVEPSTLAITLSEVEAAEFLAREKVKKPTVGFIAGSTAPPGRRMGHAGAVISGGRDTAAAKMEAMRMAGIHVSESPAALGSTMVHVLQA